MRRPYDRTCPLPPNEAERLAALRRYAILDTDREGAFDRVVRLAARQFDVPIALVSLIDEDRQWFKAACGIDAEQSSRDVAFCAHAILQDDVFVVPDATKDERFAQNPFVTEGIGIRFYAGAPLIDSSGLKLGTLCLIDDEPRAEFSADEQALLQDLAALVIDQIEMRRAAGNVLGEVETRIRAEGDLAVAEHQINLFFEHAPMPVAMLDREMRYLAASRRWNEIYGLGDRSIVGQSHYDLFPTLPGEWREQHARCLTGQVIEVEEDEITLPDGKTHWVRRQLRPWRDRDGAIGGIIMSNEIITERKAIEQQFVQAQKMESVGQLTGGLAHDFNNILGIVLGNLQLMERSVRGDERAERRVGAALSAVEKGAELTRRLLAFSRRQQLETELVEPNPLIEGLSDLLHRTLGGSVALECQLGDHVPCVRTDTAQLESALLNLAVNARDAMPDGGTLTIESELVHLDEEDAARENDMKPGDYVQIAVTDTGCGIPADTIESVFEPFFTTKEVGKGSGLGLSMVYGFMKQSGGHARIYSEVARGTTVRLFLPVASGDSSDRPVAAPPVTEGRGGTETILVVEDQRDVREVAVALLEDLGYRVLEAENAAQALDLLHTRSDIELLFTDIVMPGGMDGTRLAQVARETHPDLPVVFTTGYAQAAVLREGKVTSNSSLVTKPYRRADLAAKIRQTFDEANDARRAA